MPSIEYIIYKSQTNYAMFTCKIHVRFLMRKLFNILFSSVACTQWLHQILQKHNDLARVKRAELKGAHEHSKSL